MTNPSDILLTKLSWDELEDWAGDTIVERGKGYRDNVLDPRLTADGELLAWVDGSETYTTMVWRNPDGALDHRCTCPYSWGPCKHAVALLLEASGMVADGQTMPAAEPDDVRFDAWNEPEANPSIQQGKLLRGVAWCNVPRAVPVIGLHSQQQQSFNLGAVVGQAQSTQ